MQAAIPWWGKMALKIVLARLPVKRLAWKKLGVFNFGPMEQPEYAYRVFMRHFTRYRRPRPGFVTLEVGPGHSAFSAMISRAYGGSITHLVDVGDFIDRDVNIYRAMAEFLEKKRPALPEVIAAKSFDEIAAACSAHYITNGLESLRSIPDRSVDFLFSHAVLQSVHRSQFAEYLREFRRVLREDGVSSHLVDLRDLLGGALNHLRFSDRLWHSAFIERSGFYSNRIRYAEMMNLFKEAGFDSQIADLKRWAELPTPRSHLGRFRHLSDEDLTVSVFQVVAKPASVAAETAKPAQTACGPKVTSF
jgi:SAM-dependent methyltransferase